VHTLPRTQCVLRARQTPCPSRTSVDASADAPSPGGPGASMRARQWAGKSFEGFLRGMMNGSDGLGGYHLCVAGLIPMPPPLIPTFSPHAPLRGEGERCRAVCSNLTRCSRRGPVSCPNDAARTPLPDCGESCSQCFASAVAPPRLRPPHVGSSFCAAAPHPDLLPARSAPGRRGAMPRGLLKSDTLHTAWSSELAERCRAHPSPRSRGEGRVRGGDGS
jgi:hypothetical protein